MPILLAVLLPLGWAAAGAIDRVVEKILWPRTRRELRSAAAAALASHAAVDGMTGTPQAAPSGQQTAPR